MAIALKIGLFSDAHSDKDGGFSGGNDYGNANLKVQAFKNYMNATFNPHIVMELGDFTNTGVLGDSGIDWDWVNDEFELCTAPRYHAIGNHEIDSPSVRSDWLTATGHASTSYSFDKEGFHIIVLDTVYDDLAGNEPITDNLWYVKSDDLTWLTNDLAATDLPVLVFSHITFDDPLSVEYFRVENRASVRTILENSGKTIVGCIGGHRHGNYKSTINGIEYTTLYSMVSDAYPGTAYSALTVYKDNDTYLLGTDNQSTYNTAETFDFDLYYAKIEQTEAMDIFYVDISQTETIETKNLDGKVKVVVSEENLLDGKVVVKLSDTNLLDGKVVLKIQETLSTPITLLEEWKNDLWVFAYGTTVAVYNSDTEVITNIKTDFPTSDPYVGVRHGDFFFVCNGSTKVIRIDIDTLTPLVLTDAPLAKVLAIIDSRLFAGNLTGTIVGGGEGDESTVVWAEQDTTNSTTPFANWTTTASPPFADDPSSFSFKRAGTVTSIIPHEGGVLGILDSGKTDVIINTLDVSGVGIAQKTDVRSQREDMGGERGAIETSKGSFYVNESGLWFIPLGADLRSANPELNPSRIFGQDFIDNLNFTEADLVYDNIKNVVYVTCRQNSEHNNLILWYNINNKSFGKITGWTINRFMKIGKDIYGADSVLTQVFKLFDGSDDNGLSIFTEWEKELNLGGINDLFTLVRSAVKGFISLGSDITLSFDIYDKFGVKTRNFKQYSITSAGIVSSLSGFNGADFNDSGFATDNDTSNDLETRSSVRTPVREFSRIIARINSDDKFPHSFNWMEFETAFKKHNTTSNFLTLK